MDDYMIEFEEHKEYNQNPEVPKEKKIKESDPFVTYTFKQIFVCLIGLVIVFSIGLFDGKVADTVKAQYDEIFRQKTSANEILDALSLKPKEPAVISQDTATATDLPSPTDVTIPQSDSEPKVIQTAAKVSFTKPDTVINSMVLPLKGRITSEFGYRDHPIYGEELFHYGIDIGGEYGDGIKAALPGTVVVAEYNQSYGNYVKLDHTGGLFTLYAHCDSLNVKVGDKVNASDVIALVGSTGVSTGPHLHFEVITGEFHINPRFVLPL